MKRGTRLLGSDDAHVHFLGSPKLHDMMWLQIYTQMKKSIAATEKFFVDADKSGWFREQASLAGKDTSQPSTSTSAYNPKCLPGKPALSSHTRVNTATASPSHFIDPSFPPRETARGANNADNLPTKATVSGEQHRIVPREPTPTLANMAHPQDQHCSCPSLVGPHHTPLWHNRRQGDGDSSDMRSVPTMVKEIKLKRLVRAQNGNPDARGDDLPDVNFLGGKYFSFHGIALPKISEVFADDEFMKDFSRVAAEKRSPPRTVRAFDVYVYAEAYRVTHPFLVKAMTTSDHRAPSAPGPSTDDPQARERFQNRDCWRCVVGI
ncbi:hypothetical protein F4804DRAFT_331664 [Jackrogersella minutella]|nr:hypothetical protein F4804DRAFT_331664 [Jackrogersella minutella]